MKDKIIEEAIILLKEQGLKFNVNDIALNLKISKKTIYKYFPSKDALALAVYEKLFQKFNSDIRLKNTFDEKIRILYKAIMFLRDDIFNRFSLNHQIYEYASIQIEELWKNTESFISKNINSKLNLNVLKKIILNSLIKIDYDQIDEYSLILKRGILND